MQRTYLHDPDAVDVTQNPDCQVKKNQKHNIVWNDPWDDAIEDDEEHGPTMVRTARINITCVLSSSQQQQQQQQQQCGKNLRFNRIGI